MFWIDTSNQRLLTTYADLQSMNITIFINHLFPHQFRMANIYIVLEPSRIGLLYLGCGMDYLTFIECSLATVLLVLSGLPSE